MIDALPLLLADDGYQISRSVRLRSSASAYFNRTPASAGNRRTWTWSAWVKRSQLGASQIILNAGTGADDRTSILFESTDKLNFFTGTTGPVYRGVQTTAVFRDPSAWYHIVVSVDTTQTTDANRVKLYVNGVQQAVTTYTGGYNTLNQDTNINTATGHNIGRQLYSASTYLDGYLTEINFIDGQALTPASFGETDAVTGVWRPKKYVGTYGTNGFYLNFSDPSAATAAAIGKDYSGNGNNWTPNNISVTAGTTYDSMLDVPTQWADGGNGRGNYCVLNPLTTAIDLLGVATLSNGNLQSTSGGANARLGIGSIFVTSGKWYAECTITTSFADYVGIGSQTNANSTASGTGAYSYTSGGPKASNASSSSYGASYTTGDVIGVAYDADAGTLVFYKNGVSQGTAYTGIDTSIPRAFCSFNAGTGTYVHNWNFGQRPFSYTPPSGFLALNTQNLPVPTILKGNQFFDATTYTGNGSTQSIVNSGAMQPDFVWIKDRTTAYQHCLFDAVRGVQIRLESNTTAAEQNNAASLTAFNSNGFSLGNNVVWNGTGDSYVAWQWKEGATQGFDIVTYTGNGANRTIAHNLGVAPKMIILKARTGSATDWYVYHANANASPATGLLYLNLTNAFTSSATAWNNTAPTSSVFSLGTASGGNANTINYVAYLFAEVAGFSRFGSYTGNGSADGPFVYTGFRPAFVMIKSSSSAGGNWLIQNNKTLGYNPSNSELYANLSNAETTADRTDLLSNGFKPRINSAENNSSGVTYIYAAFAEVPFRYALAR